MHHKLQPNSTADKTDTVLLLPQSVQLQLFEDCFSALHPNTLVGRRQCLPHSIYTQAYSSFRNNHLELMITTWSIVLGHVGRRKKKKTTHKHVLHICHYHLGYTRGCPYFIPELLEVAAWLPGWDRRAGLNIMGMLGACWLAAGSADLEAPPSPSSWACKTKHRQGWLRALEEDLKMGRWWWWGRWSDFTSVPWDLLKTKFTLNASWPWPWSRFVQTETLVFIQASTKCSLFSLPIKISDNSWWCAASSEWTESWWKILTFFFSCLFLAVIVTVLVTDGHKSSLSVGYKQSVLIVGQMYHPIQTVIEKVSLCYKDTYLNTCLKWYMHPTY